jgi:hypothetical protein
MDQDQQQLRVFADNDVNVFNENHLLEFMKLTEATDDELQEILYPELNEFLTNQEYLASNSKSSQELELSSNNESIKATS